MNRKIQPEIQTLKDFRILPPVRTTLPNGIPLTVINVGEQDVVRMDILFGGGRWQQSQKLQALFTNRMLREGTIEHNGQLPLFAGGVFVELLCIQFRLQRRKIFLQRVFVHAGAEIGRASCRERV